MSVKIDRGPGLHEAQRIFAACLLEPGRPAPPATWIRDPPRGTPAERMAVYANGYPARLEEALRETYPGLAHLVGAAAFADLARRYTRARPPLVYNLSDVGAALPAYLLSDQLGARLPFLPDLAELEWRLSRAFHASEGAPLDPTAVAAWDIADWQRAVLRFQPSLALVCSPWPIRTLWELRETPRDAIDLDLRDRPERVLVYRSGWDVCCELVDEAAARALLALLAGRSLGEVADKLAADGHAVDTAFAWLPRLRGRGVITRCELANALPQAMPRR